MCVLEGTRFEERKKKKKTNGEVLVPGLALDEGGLGLADALEDVRTAFLVAVRTDAQVHLVLARVGAVRGRHTEDRVGRRLQHVRPVDGRDVARRAVAARRAHRQRRHNTVRGSREHWGVRKKDVVMSKNHKGRGVNQKKTPKEKREERKRKKTPTTAKTKEKDGKQKKKEEANRRSRVTSSTRASTKEKKGKKALDLAIT